MRDVLRSSKVQKQYRTRHKKQGGFNPEFFETKPGKEYKYWRLIENDFPYDRVAKKHSLLSPRRNFINDWEMKDEERQELFEIKKEVSESQEYDSILENIPHNRSLPSHYHLHFVKWHFVTDFSKSLDKK